MSAALETWPDGTPKASALMRQRWNEGAPLAGPPVEVDFDTIELAGVVFERKPEGLDVDYTPRGGTVVKKGRDEETGRPWVEALNTKGPAHALQIVRFRLWVDELGEYQPPTRRWAHGTARRICRAIGGPLDNAYLAAWEKEALLIALGLVHAESVA